MSRKYHYDHRSTRHPFLHVAFIISFSIIAIAIVVIFVAVVITHEIGSQSKKTGSSRIVGHIYGDTTDATGVSVTQPTFTMTLPAGWRQTGNISSNIQNSVSWESGPSDQGTRYLTVYIDRILPNLAINNLLPIIVHGQSLSYGTLSGNCADFTPASPQDTEATVPAKWQDINFICNVPDKDYDEVGTGSPGVLNSFSVTGPSEGTHNYFFAYTDHNAEPNYNIFYQIINSFKAR